MCEVIKLSFYIYYTYLYLPESATTTTIANKWYL